MKKITLLIVLFCSVVSWGQIYQHNFGTTAITAHPYTVAPTLFNANLNSSSWSNSSGAWTSFAGSTGQAIALNNSSGTPTVTLTFNVVSGYQISVSSFDFWRQRSTSGAQNWSMTINGVFVGSGTIPTTGAAIGTTTVTNPVSNLTGTITVVMSLSGASGNGTFRLDDFILNGTVTPTGPVSITSGDWNVGSTWNTGTVPNNTDYVTISSGHIVHTNTALTRDGNTQVNGTFELRNGGFASGAGTFNYNTTTGSLNFNASSSYGVDNTHVYWPTSNGPFNVNVLSGGLTLNIGANRTVNGAFSTAAGVTLTGATLTLNGTCSINGGGFFQNSPIYGVSSTLLYNTSGVFNRGLEWAFNGVGTIGTTPGYPNNVQLSNNTTFNYNNGTPLSKAIAGNLTVDAGSSFYMDYGGGASGGTLTVAGNIVNNGNFSLGNATGDDLRLNGNFTNTGVFNGNGRAIFFTKNGTQTISSTPLLTIPYVVQQPSSGINTIQLLSNLIVSAPAGGNAITFSSASDVFDLNNRTLTIGTSGIANTISGAGTFRGSTTSNLTLIGIGSIGTLRFTSGSQILNNLTLNRQNNTIGFDLGTDVSINGTLTLTNGIANLSNRTMIITNAGAISGASSTNYIIADYTSGGILRKNFNSIGTFTFPIGDRVSSAEGSQYSPATLTFASGTFSSGYIAISVEDSKEPNNEAPVDFITRYWNVTSAGITNATYSFSGTYLPADINGTESNSKSGRLRLSNLQWLEGANITAGSNTISLTGMDTSVNALSSAGGYNFTGGSPFKRAEINIQQGSTNYLSGSSYDFGTQTVGSTTNIVFTIQNLGLENLSLDVASLTGTAYTLSANYNPTVSGGGTTTFTISFNPLSLGTHVGSISISNNDTTGLENPYIINFTGIGQNSMISDIINAGGEAVIVPSIENDAIVNTTTDGIRVWQFTIRDGGAGASDLDLFPTIVNSLTLTQSTGNQVNDWADAIQSVALFDGTTKIAEGVVSVNQIVFSGAPLISVPDNGSVTLTVRLSVEINPNNSGSNLDGDDFVFNILSANATAASTGSQFASFAAATSANGQNVLSVIATQLEFTQQPITTGINTGMTDVIVAATDVNGNVDIDFNGAITITSSGSMTGSPLSISAISGIAVFSEITHTSIGTFFNLNASFSGLISATSTFFDITNITNLVPGDLAIVAVNRNIGASGEDQFAFVSFQDILPGTKIYITDNGYERSYSGVWGGTEGLISITRTGTTLPKGSIIVFESNTGNVTNASQFAIYTCGSIDTNWQKTALSGVSIGGFNLNSDDDIWIMQGGIWVNDTSHNSTYNGTVLYGWTESGWNANPGGSSGGTTHSTLYPSTDCFTTNVVGESKVKFNDPNDPDFSASTNGRLEWISLINDSANWDTYSDNASYNAGGYDYKGNTTCSPMTIATNSYVNGKWTGREDTNWFNCGNWDTLKVPDETVDVLVEDTTFNNAAVVDITAPFALEYGNIAKVNNLTITGEKVEVAANVNNVLEIHGSLIIDGTGVLDMNDGNNATADGTIHLHGDWSNLIDETAFDQGNGTVHFEGSIPQIITSLDPIGTEIFHHVVLNNDFDTTISNNLIAQGNLNVNATKVVTVQPNDYIQVNNALQLNGSIVIENEGQLIQVNETDANSGTYSGTRFQVKRVAKARNLDYVYWSSPVENFNVANLPNSHRFEWLPTAINANSTQGNWSTPSGSMIKGQGYIARASNGSAIPVDLPIIFQGGKPYNGQFNYTIFRGSTAGINDCWNLVGNPYPSAIDADLFLSDNLAIEGSIRIWSHGTLPAGNPTPSPFYQNFAYNYTEDDYIIYNGTATTVPAAFNGKIASGQGFFIRMLEDGETDINPPVSDVVPASADITFKNEYRSDVINGYLYDNSEFFRSSAAQTIEKSRIWLDLIAPNNQITKTVIGYVPGATLAKDRIYDALIHVDSFKLYSLINTQKQAIQGRPVPFDNNDQVPLGVNIQNSGNYTIAISAVDGLFLNASQNIYLEDKLLHIIHDIKQAPYTFSTLAGQFNDRFVLRYTNTVLSSEQNEILSGLLIVSKEQVSLLAAQPIKSIIVYDVLGRKIYEKNNINALQITLEELIPTKEALVVKTTLESGTVVTRKIIY